jgi:hypothetical protein
LIIFTHSKAFETLDCSSWRWELFIAVRWWVC